MRLSWQGDCSREHSTGCWLDSRDCPADCSIDRLLKVVERSESLDSEDLRLLSFDVEKRPGSMVTFNALGCGSSRLQASCPVSTGAVLGPVALCKPRGTVTTLPGQLRRRCWKLRRCRWWCVILAGESRQTAPRPASGLAAGATCRPAAHKKLPAHCTIVLHL